MLSSLFRRDPAYRRFFRLYQDINLGIASVFGDFLQMPLARTFELYELWCFLRLVRAGAEAYGPAGLVVTDLFITEAAGGLTIKERGSRFRSGAAGSYAFRSGIENSGLNRTGAARTAGSWFLTSCLRRQGRGCSWSFQTDSARCEVPDRRRAVRCTELDPQLQGCAGPGGRRRKDRGLRQCRLSACSAVRDTEANYRDTPMPGRLFHPEYRRSFRFGL